MREENDTWTPRKLTREAARAEQRVYWSTKSIAERLRAMSALTRRLYAMRGINLNDFKADFTVSRVLRRKG